MEHDMERNLDNMISNPPRYFNHPAEVLNEPVSTADKRRILESWKHDAQQLAQSTAENMSGGEEGDLREVSKTLIQLNTAEPPVKTVPARPKTGVTLGLAIGALAGAGVALLFLAASNGFSAAAREGWMTPISVLVEATVAGGLVGGIVSAIRAVGRE
jgi:hypothetical protein